MSLRLAAGLLKATRLVRKSQLRLASTAIKGALGVMRPPRARNSRAFERSLRALGALLAPRVTARKRVAASDSPSALKARQRGSFVPGTFANEYGTREYKVYIPALHGRRALPLVVMLHGCKQEPDDFAAGTGMNALAEEHGFLVVYPTQARSANCSRCWNWFQTQDQTRDSGEPSLIAGITREVIAGYRIDPQRIYVAGLSAGGAMAAIMATTYPDLYTAVGIHSGLPYAAASDVSSAFAAMRGEGGARASEASRENDALREVPAIVFHGDDDRTVHPSNAEQLLAQAAPPSARAQVRAAADGHGIVERGDTRGRAYTKTLYRNARGKSVMEHWLVHGAGHAWSGGSAAGSYTDTNGPDASREMLRFFLQHS